MYVCALLQKTSEAQKLAISLNSNLSLSVSAIMHVRTIQQLIDYDYYSVYTVYTYVYVRIFICIQLHKTYVPDTGNTR